MLVCDMLTIPVNYFFDDDECMPDYRGDCIPDDLPDDDDCYPSADDGSCDPDNWECWPDESDED